MYDDREPDYDELEETPTATDAIESLAQRIAASVAPEDLTKASEQAAKQLVAHMTHEIKKEAATVVREACSKELKVQIQHYMQQALQDVLKTKIVRKEEYSWDQSLTSIAEVLRAEMEKTLNSIKGDRDGSAIQTLFKKFVDKEVGDMCSTALNEFKAELKAEFEKTTMKKMVQGIASAIGSDKRLLAILSTDAK